MEGASVHRTDTRGSGDRASATIPVEGYVFHSYGDKKYVRHVIASVLTLRRYDRSRPVALYCTREHQRSLRESGLQSAFAIVEDLPDRYRSITGFKLNLDRFLPFDRNLVVDADMVWCRDPDPLWMQLSAYPFTATGRERSDFFFGGPKGIGVVLDVVRDLRRQTLKRFNLTWLPRVQAGMIYASDPQLAAGVCRQARHYLERRPETHFRSRIEEGRPAESCEWSLAMAMSRLSLPVHPWFQGFNSPQLDYIEGMTLHDADFNRVKCRYYSDPGVYSLRGIKSIRLRKLLIRVTMRLPGRGDYQDVTPFALHFGWAHFKPVFSRYADHIWENLTHREAPSERSETITTQVAP